MTEYTDALGEEIAKRRVPCLITYLSPFTLVESQGAPSWKSAISEINGRSWDYVGLHRNVAGVEVGLPAPYHMLIGADGALALPPVSQIRTSEQAADFFNRCLAAILIGGIYCEAVNPDGIDLGYVLDWKYIRSMQSGLAAPNQFHERMRRLQAAPLEAIQLLNPRRIEVADLVHALQTGTDILQRASPLRADFLLKGVTAFARRDWTTALANLWIVIEQLLSSLWQRFVVTPSLEIDNSRVRKDQLNDSRTWTSLARIEMLYQKDVVSLATVGLLSKARRARNDLSHAGSPATEDVATSAYDATKDLLAKVLDDDTVPLFRLDLRDHTLSDPFVPIVPKGSPTHWMPIQWLPGELELSRTEELRRRRRKE
jgi:hypothetical protein